MKKNKSFHLKWSRNKVSLFFLTVAKWAYNMSHKFSYSSHLPLDETDPFNCRCKNVDLLPSWFSHSRIAQIARTPVYFRPVGNDTV